MGLVDVGDSATTLDPLSSVQCLTSKIYFCSSPFVFVFLKRTPLLGVGSIQLVAMTRGAMSLTHADYSKNAIMQTCRLLRTHVCHDGDSTLHNSCLSSSFST